MIKVMTVFGTRPEAIKMAPLVKALQARLEIETIVCVSAQHREMLDQVLDIFKIEPDYDLNIMKQGQSLAEMTSSILEKLSAIIAKEQPHLVLVHGDTSTTFAASLAAFYQHVSIGHVEAGLRTYNKYAPFPEEANRQLVSNIADIHFVPTQNAAYNLIKEGKNSEDIYITGNTAIDALQHTVHQNFHHDILDWVGDDKLILLTCHRRENQGEGMQHIFQAVKRIVEENKDVKVVYPVHLNPSIQQLAKDCFSSQERMRLIEPLDVIAFHNFINHAYFIMTDSGGIQEEAPSLGVPVLVLRDTTERPEGVKAKTLKLVGTNETLIYEEATKLLHDNAYYQSMSQASNPYGDGKASQRIVDIILDRLG